MATKSTTRTTRRAVRGPLKGRAWIAIGLGVFLVVASLVVWRRGVGAETARELARSS